MNIDYSTVLMLHWAAFISYLIGTVAILAGKTVRKPLLPICFIAAGACIHAAGLLWLCRETGYLPFMGAFEVLSINSLLIVVAGLILARPTTPLYETRHIINLIVLVMLSTALIQGPRLIDLPPVMNNFWAYLHIIFFKLAFVAIALAFSLSITYGLKIRKHSDSTVEVVSADFCFYRAAGVGFILWTAGMLAAAVWGCDAFGKFSGWDTPDVWVITWVILGGHLHLLRFFNLKRRTLALSYLFVFSISVFALYIAPELIFSVHARFSPR